METSKIGAIQDIVHGIDKLLVYNTKTNENEETHVDNSVLPLLERIKMFLEDGEWKKADEYCEKVLDLQADCAQAYLGKLMCDLRVSSKEKLASQENTFEDNKNYQKAIRFADDNLKNELKEYMDTINQRNNLSKYNYALGIFNSANNSEDYDKAISILESIVDFKDSRDIVVKCKELKQQSIDNYNKEMVEKISDIVGAVSRQNAKNETDRINNDIDNNNIKLNELNNILETFDDTYQKVINAQYTIGESQNTIIRLQNKKNSLGIFSDKEI